MDEASTPGGIELSADGLRCVLRPDLGGCIAGLWFDGVPVLRSLPAVRSARESGNFPLVPFSNRITNARLQWGGTTYELARNFAPEPHAMHGLGWQVAWTVERSDTHSARLQLAHAASPAWPFAFECMQQFALEQGALRVTLELTNTAPVAAPAGLGWHPYVVKRPGASLRFGAAGRWETDTQGLPVRRVASGGLDASCDALDVNHAYDGWNGTALVRDPVLEVTITSNLSRLVASTNPSKDFVAVEPVSHIPDSFNRNAEAMGTAVLQPGESLRAGMRIAVRRSS